MTEQSDRGTEGSHNNCGKGTRSEMPPSEEESKVDSPFPHLKAANPGLGSYLPAEIHVYQQGGSTAASPAHRKCCHVGERFSPFVNASDLGNMAAAETHLCLEIRAKKTIGGFLYYSIHSAFHH